MKNYNSNFKSSGVHTVKVTVANGIYRATFKVKLSGNCTGWSILDAAVQVAFDDFIKDNGYGLPVTNQIISAYSAMGIKKIYFKESTCYESYKVDTIAQYNQQINSLFS